MRGPCASRIYVFCALATAACVVSAGEAPGNVQRLQLERDQQQSELRLKMEQQQERAVRPAPSPAADAQRHQLERDQQQRLQQLHDQQSRGAVTQGGAGIERERAGQTSVEQAKRFETERRTEEYRAAGQPQR